MLFSPNLSLHNTNKKSIIMYKSLFNILWMEEYTLKNIPLERGFTREMFWEHSLISLFYDLVSCIYIYHSILKTIFQSNLSNNKPSFIDLQAQEWSSKTMKILNSFITSILPDDKHLKLTFNLLKCTLLCYQTVWMLINKKIDRCLLSLINCVCFRLEGLKSFILSILKIQKYFPEISWGKSFCNHSCA